MCQARFAHQHPAWHIVNCQQIDLIGMESLDALLKPHDVVRDTLAPFSLELVHGKEHLETLTLFLWALVSKLCPDGFCLPSLPIVRDVSGCGRQLQVSHRQTNSSCCSLQATNHSRCNGPVDFKVLACFVQADFLLGSSAHSGAPSCHTCTQAGRLVLQAQDQSPW